MTRSATESFTMTNAKVLASRVTADMRRCQQNYGRPTDTEINDYGTELAFMLRDKYLANYEFGYERDGKRIVSFYYVVKDGELTDANDRPGKIVSGVDITGASFFNFMDYTSAWWQQSDENRKAYRNALPIRRTPGSPPADGAGYWVNDRVYSSGGVSLDRRTFRPY